MNIILIAPPPDLEATTDFPKVDFFDADLSRRVWTIEQPRQLAHIRQFLQPKVGDSLKVGVLNYGRFVCEVLETATDKVYIKPLHAEPVPPKIPLTLIVALPRPKVLRRLVADSVALGVQKLVFIHSYRVDKSYWQTPLLRQFDDYVQLGLEQSGDVFAPEIELYPRFKPFVEDILAVWTQQQPSFVAHPYAARAAPVAFNQPCQVLIGPEGGFIPYEIDLLQENGVQAVTMGQRILRTETAVPVLLARLFTT